MYCCTTFFDATFLIPIKLPSTTYNMLRHVSTCINKMVKRSRLFPLDKCCMLYCEKSSSFDQGLRRLRSDLLNPKFGSQKSALLWLKSHSFLKKDLTYFNKVKFTRNFRSCSKNWIEKQDGRFVAMVAKDLQTLNLRFDQVMFNSLVLKWERNFEVTFGIFSVLVFQISVLESYLDIYLF